MEPIRIGIVGCGAVTQRYHLPALQEVPDMRLSVLVDADTDRAREAADAAASIMRRPEIVSSIDDLVPLVDAALVCTSNTSHAAIAVRLLRGGKHVLVEKPLATNMRDANAIREARNGSGAIVAVGHVRRLFPIAVWVQRLIDDRALGEIRRILWYEGTKLAWSAAPPSMFRIDRAGGGVVLDLGVHVFDLLRHWAGRDAEIIQYSDDSAGGIESEASMRLRLGNILADIELSRRRTLGNLCMVAGTNRILRIKIGVPGTFEMFSREGQLIEEGTVPVLAPAEPGWTSLYVGQLRAFADAIRTGSAPFADLEAGVQTVRLAKACYSSTGRGRSVRHWEKVDEPGYRLVGSRVAVTGASGFLGARLAEVLTCGEGANVRALTHSLNHQPRLSRLPNERFDAQRTDLLNPGRLAEAFYGVDTVIHCAYGSSGPRDQQWRTTVDGTANVVQACLDASVRRLVYVSSISVYEPLAIITEDTEYLSIDSEDQGYNQQKLHAENIVHQAIESGLDAVVVQPGTIYGPSGPLWTTMPIKRLRARLVQLPTSMENKGICNAVFVDDVVEALIRAAVTPEAKGERLIVTGPAPVTWGEFFDAYRAMLPAAASSVGMEELPEWEQELYARQSRIESKRAERVLGYRPKFDLTAGMAAVKSWAQWCGLLSGRPEIESTQW